MFNKSKLKKIITNEKFLSKIDNAKNEEELLSIFYSNMELLSESEIDEISELIEISSCSAASIKYDYEDDSDFDDLDSDI